MAKTAEKTKSNPKTESTSKAKTTKLVESTQAKKSKLVIVESPAKAKTIGKILGKDYRVIASLGHVRDLLRSQLSVDVENEFTPKYRVPNERREVIKEIKKEAEKASEVFLATDLDREGEAIAWHLMEAVGIEPARALRVKFDEITKPAIEEAFRQPGRIDMDKVNAQQARRILDRLVGYSLSPLLWAKVRSRLSAGRVQSVALRLVVDRERTIEEFNSQEYWTIAAELLKSNEKDKRNQFTARLHQIGEQKVGLEKEIPLANQGEVAPHLVALEQANWQVGKVKKSQRQRRPNPPFTTSTLQQEASKRLGYTTKRTMALAQQLYEGVDVGEGGTVGLITYMRTDSVNISQQAQQEAREYILSKHGADYVPAEPPVYKQRAKGAQEAHEAIRPTSVLREPARLKEFLTRDQFRLYELIWKRFLASQMENALFDTVTVDIVAKTGVDYLFRSSGATLRFAGFLVVYEQVTDEDDKSAETDEENTATRIPPLDDGDLLDLRRLLPEQHYTQPPPRFTEAALVKMLEENGIGRPSTYSSIINTIQDRGYVAKEEKRLFPTDTGFLVNDLLVDHFDDIVDPGFTARMEEQLDEIAHGEVQWVPVLSAFYTPFAGKVATAQEKMPKVSAEPEKIGRACPSCNHDLIIRFGRFGKFIGCSNFPECRHVEPLLESIGVKCPQDGGEIVERRSKKGRTFYGCRNYPACEWTSWKRPVAQPCPKCGNMLTIRNKESVQCGTCESIFPYDVSANVFAETEAG
jgi:DNA topoisomerase-1